jgi:hypothetical protein
VREGLRANKTFRNSHKMFIYLTSGSGRNFSKRWNPQNLGETLLLLLLGRDMLERAGLLLLL